MRHVCWIEASIERTDIDCNVVLQSMLYITLKCYVRESDAPLRIFLELRINEKKIIREGQPSRLCRPRYWTAGRRSKSSQVSSVHCKSDHPSNPGHRQLLLRGTVQGQAKSSRIITYLILYNNTDYYELNVSGNVYVTDPHTFSVEVQFWRTIFQGKTIHKVTISR